MSTNSNSSGHHVDDSLLNSRQAAKLLSISERKLWSLANEGDLPCVKFGRTVRYDKEDIKAWINKQKI
ncbi:MAG: DNA-binding protein [Blastopirellula sp.]|nr:MAG: DNA-binding protein [Blastopirellula sp.]